MKIIITRNRQQTFQLGKKIARGLAGGEILALSGCLGSGKTVLVKGVAAGLGIAQTVRSPSFNLMKIYRLPPALKKRRSPVRRLVHLDCYRLASEKEAVDLGLLDYLGKPRTVVAVEWPEKIKKILKKFRVRRFAFSHLKNGGRKIAYSFPPPDISPKRTFST